jgi:hypothetical protein
MPNNNVMHFWQTAPGSGDWAGETRFAQDGANQVAVARDDAITWPLFRYPTRGSGSLFRWPNNKRLPLACSPRATPPRPPTHRNTNSNQ